MRRARWHLLALGLVAGSASAQPFDWDLLVGRWAESAEHAYACRSDNVHFRFETTSDRSRLTFKLDRPWPIAGRERTEYGATIVEAVGRLLVIRYGSDLAEMPADMREWELLFIRPGVYRWRATSWPAGRYNQVIGVRCGT
jgi:hypothetical protein